MGIILLAKPSCVLKCLADCLVDARSLAFLGERHFVEGKTGVAQNSVSASLSSVKKVPALR